MPEFQDIPDIPDPSATERPQTFDSEHHARLKERVFEAVDRELGDPDAEDSVGPDLDPKPDKKVVDFDPDDYEEGTSLLKTLLLGTVVFTISATLVFGLLMVLLFVLVLLMSMF